MKTSYWYDKILIILGLTLIGTPTLLKFLGYSFIWPMFDLCYIVGGFLLSMELLLFIVFVFIAYLDARVQLKDE